MNHLYRACPSGRLQTSDFVKHRTGDAGYRVAIGAFFGLIVAITPRRPTIDSTGISLPVLYSRRRTKGPFRVSPDSRLRAGSLVQEVPTTVSWTLANKAFFGALIAPSFLTVLTAPSNGIGSILLDPGTFVPPVYGVTVISLDPAYGTVLVDVTLFGFVPFLLAITRPRSFDPGGGTTANVGYGG